MSKLGLNQELIAKARASAHKVAADVQAFIDEHTTVTVERAVCRLLGIDGVNEVEVPLPNVVVDHLKEKRSTFRWCCILCRKCNGCTWCRTTGNR